MSNETKQLKVKQNKEATPIAAISETLEPEKAPIEPTAPTNAKSSSAESELTPQQVEDLKSKAAKADEYLDRLLRQAADLENFKKRVARERQEAIKFANESLLQKLIPAMDNFDMALAAASSMESSSLESIKTGVTMIYSQLKAAITEAGLEEIDATNQRFDPNWHEAVSHQESADVPEGHVLQQLRKGYKLRDRLIRPATVVVAKKPGENSK